MNEFPAETKRKQCKKPCFNCPFRSDMPPYQSEVDVMDNTIIVLRYHEPDVRAICHFSAHQAGNLHSRMVINPDEKHVCAGFLLMRQKLGLPIPAGCHRIKDQPYVFDSLAKFFLHSLCQSREQLTKWQLWSAEKNPLAYGRYAVNFLKNK